MTYEEAIEIIKNNYPKTAKMVNGRYKGGFDDTESKLGKALNMAIEALEKQIQKKPLKSDKTIRYCEVWECPGCGFEWSGRVVDYCYRCGQAINWEGVKEEE